MPIFCTTAAGHGERTRGPVVPDRRRARACGRSGEGAASSISQRRAYARASDTPSSHCGRCGAARSGGPLRPQDGRGLKICRRAQGERVDLDVPFRILSTATLRSAEKLASWVGICPGNNESAGKRKSGKTRKGNAWVRRLLCVRNPECRRAQDAKRDIQVNPFALRSATDF